MKKQLFAAAAALMLTAAPVYAESETNEVYKTETADGAVFSLYYSEDAEGRLVYDSYCITEVRVMESADEFLALGESCSSDDISLAGSEMLIYEDFSCDFDETEGIIGIEGTKFYVIDKDAHTVRYAGADYITEEIISSDENEMEYDTAEIKAEDGTSGHVYVYDDYSDIGWEIGFADPADASDFPEYSGGSGKYYSRSADIVLGENEELIEYEFSFSDANGHVISGKKFYIITSDGINSSLRYAGHEITDDIIPQSDGASCAPETGSKSVLPIMAAASAAMAAARSRKK